MPDVFGPLNPRHVYGGEPLTLQSSPPVRSGARTLGDALADYEAAFSVTVRPCDDLLPGQTELKYFRLAGREGEGQLVDIHVIRAGVEVCPRHDLEFELGPDDLVEMGELVC